LNNSIYSDLVITKEIPSNAILGYLVGMVFRQFRIPKAEFETYICEAGVPQDYRPKLPRPVFAFQLACRELEETVVEDFIDPGTGKIVRLEVDYMIDALNAHTRQLSRKIKVHPESEISEEMKKLLEIHTLKEQKEPEKICLFVFEDGQILKIDLFKENKLAIAEMAQRKYQQLLEYYDMFTNCYTERYLKEAYYKLCEKSKAIPFLLAPGAVRFFPVQYQKDLESFMKLYKLVYGERGLMRKIPVIKTKDLKKQIKADLEVEIQKRFERFLRTVASRIEEIKDEEELEKYRNIAKAEARKFERELEYTLINEYSRLLSMSIKAKLEDMPMPESVRLQKAREFLLAKS